MAKRVIEVLTSDLSGDEMKPGEGRTVDFSIDGTSYTIDLTEKEAAGFDKALAMYVEHATKVGGKRRSNASAGRTSNKEDLAAIRGWARANGHEVSERGRIGQAVRDAYGAAQ